MQLQQHNSRILPKLMTPLRGELPVYDLNSWSAMALLLHFVVSDAVSCVINSVLTIPKDSLL